MKLKHKIKIYLKEYNLPEFDKIRKNKIKFLSIII